MTGNEKTLIAILGAIVEMSDRAEKAGGATCIAGVASLNAMQKSIQKNAARIGKIVQNIRDEASK